jgi:hypothetical protein
MLNATRIRSLGMFVGVAVVALCVLPGQALAQKNSAENVKIKATADKGKDGSRIIKLTLSVADGWYIYANPVGNEDLAPNATTVKIKGVKDADVKVTYPKAKVKEDKIVGSYKYYTGDVPIDVTVQNSSGPLEFQVQVTTCHLIRGVCLQPGTVKVIVP